LIITKGEVDFIVDTLGAAIRKVTDQLVRENVTPLVNSPMPYHAPG
jgi:hypothetical protein